MHCRGLLLRLAKILTDAARGHCDNRQLSSSPTMAEVEETALAQITGPDVLTPGQYYDGSRRDDPETHAIKRLMFAVLADAVRCFQTCTGARSRAARRILIETETWISDRDAEGPFTFEGICEMLGMEPGRLREGLREWRVQQARGMNPRRLGKRRSPVRSVGPIGAPQRRRLRRRAAEVNRFDLPAAPLPLAAGAFHSHVQDQDCTAPSAVRDDDQDRSAAA
jgi:hypothetical protein